MKLNKILKALAIMAIIATTAMATTQQTVNISGKTTVAIRTEIQGHLDNGRDVLVIGGHNETANGMMILNIPAGVRVVWNADFNMGFWLENTGTFDMIGGTITPSNSWVIFYTLDANVNIWGGKIINPQAISAVGNARVFIADRTIITGGNIHAIHAGGNAIIIERTGTRAYYEIYSQTDINTTPSGWQVSAYWNVVNGKSGISYANGANAGFIEVPGVVVIDGTTYDCELCNDKGCEVCDPCGHDIHDESGAAATCTTPKICNRNDCEHILENALGHIHQNYVLDFAATCLAVGEETAICERDDCEIPHTRNIAIDPNAHDWIDNWVITKEPTCISKGNRKRECNIVGCSVEEHDNNTDVLPINANAHDWGNWANKTPATCTEKATEERICRHSSEHKETQDVGEVLGHDMPLNWSVVKSATCAEAGERERVCNRTNCTHRITDNPPALGHILPDWSIVRNPTCTETGERQRVCDRTGCTHRVVDNPPALGHIWSEKITIPATCEAEGSETRNCNRYGCDVSDVQTLPKLQGAECATSIVDTEKSNDKYGIRFAVNPVSDKAEISIVLPNNERATETKIVVYDITGNAVFSTTARDNVSWDLRNTAGRFVANGTYLVIAEVKTRNGEIYTYSARLGVKR